MSCLDILGALGALEAVPSASIRYIYAPEIVPTALPAAPQFTHRIYVPIAFASFLYPYFLMLNNTPTPLA